LPLKDPKHPPPHTKKLKHTVQQASPLETIHCTSCKYGSKTATTIQIHASQNYIILPTDMDLKYPFEERTRLINNIFLVDCWQNTQHYKWLLHANNCPAGKPPALISHLKLKLKKNATSMQRNPQNTTPRILKNVEITVRQR
jgi:hypothetical protein